MAGSTNSLDSLSSPSPSPPPSTSKPSNAEPKSGLDSDSELSELTEEEQEAEKQKRKQASSSKPSRFINGRGATGSRPSRRGGRRKRGSIVPAPMWGWADPKTTPDDADDEDGPVGSSKSVPNADGDVEFNHGPVSTPATFSTLSKNLPNNDRNSTHTSTVVDGGSTNIKAIVEKKLAIDAPTSPLELLTTAAMEVKSVEVPAGGDETESESEETRAAQPSDDASNQETESEVDEEPAVANTEADELDREPTSTKKRRASPSSIASSRSAASSRSPSPAPPQKTTGATIASVAKTVEDEEDEVEEEDVDDADDVPPVDATDDLPSASAKKPKSKSKPSMAIAIPDPIVDVDVEPENAEAEMEVDIEVEVDVDMKEEEVEEDKEEDKEVEDEDKEDEDTKEDEEVKEEEEEEEEEEELELQPAHRIEALEILAGIELKFALLREKLYCEKMEELAWEESLVNDGTHPELIHLQGELSRRKDKRLELAHKKRTFEVANVHKRRRLDEDATWSWWKFSRDELQTDMIAETNRKKRKLDRERRALERPQPIRRIPQPPTEIPLSPLPLRKVIKSDPFTAHIQLAKRKDRRNKRDVQVNGINFSVENLVPVSYPELTILSSADVRSDLELLASFKRPTQPPLGQPAFDSHPIGHGHPHRISTPSSMIPPYDPQYTATQMNDSFAPFGVPGGRNMVPQGIPPQPMAGLSPYTNPSPLGPGPGMGSNGRPGSSAGSTRPHHIHRHPSPGPPPGHLAHGSVFSAPIEREQEMMRPYFDGPGVPIGYGSRSASPMHAGPSRIQHGMGYDDRPPHKHPYRDEREQEPLLNTKDLEYQHIMAKQPDRRFIAEPGMPMDLDPRSKRPSKEEFDGHRHRSSYVQKEVENPRDAEMRQLDRDRELIRREELYNNKHNGPHHHRQPNHYHHHHHKPHHHHVVHHHHVQQSSSSTSSPRPVNLSPRASRGEVPENGGVYNRPLPPPQSHHHPPGPGSAHPGEIINLSSSKGPPHPSSWKGEDVQGDQRDSRSSKINSRPPSGPPSLPGDERERDRHIPVPFALGASQPPPPPRPNVAPSTSSPRLAWNTPDHDDPYRSGTHPSAGSGSGSREVMGSPGHRFASSASQSNHPLSRNGLPPSSSASLSSPRSRTYRPSSPTPGSHPPPAPGRSPTRFRERERSPSTSSLPLNHSKVMRSGSPPILSQPVRASSPSTTAGPPIDIMKNGTRPTSPETSRSNGGSVPLPSSTPRLISSGGLSPRLPPANISPPKMSVPQIVDGHS
ncbi:hypothetical protein VKT23_003509 [Stygiomarasmius scandens]|uniref:Uncharacterized protein n=1 Tax=Marasmiellus scandens TaxID=2682957 RepID=A0ABR1JZ65_9AGAR